MDTYAFSDYHNLHTGDLVARLSLVCTDLANLYSEIALVEATEVRDRANAYLAASGTTSASRRDNATMTVVEPVATALELKAQRDALLEEKWLIVRILDTRRTA